MDISEVLYDQMKGCYGNYVNLKNDQLSSKFTWYDFPEVNSSRVCVCVRVCVDVGVYIRQEIWSHL